LGYYRVGEDGRLYLMTKSEHYHAPLGHAFPGYTLIEKRARWHSQRDPQTTRADSSRAAWKRSWSARPTAWRGKTRPGYPISWRARMTSILSIGF
jgi:hypothetical protein